jgi:NAD(P)H dehydrogenase (quinone)
MSDAVTRVVVIYHSGFGHTAALARSVQKGAAAVEGVQAEILTADEAAKNLDGLDSADAMIFGSPTYMGSIAAPLKAFMEASSKKWFTRAWVNKIAAGFTNSGGMSGDKLNSLIQIAIFAAQHGMIWTPQTEMVGGATGKDVNRLSSYLGLMSQSDNVAPDLAPPAGDHATAERFGKRVAEAAARWKRGSLSC